MSEQALPVAELQQRTDDVRPGGVGEGRHTGRDENRDRGEAHQGGRKQATDAAGVETPHPDVAIALSLLEQERGDQEA